MMGKKSIKLSVNEDILTEARKTIPNMSNFFEDMLKLYLESNKYDIQLNNITQQITELNFKRSVLMKTKLDKKYEERDLYELKNNLWNRLYSNYSIQKDYSWDLMKECIEVLGYSEEFLVSIMDALLDNVGKYDNLKAKTDWEYVLSLFDDI